MARLEPDSAVCHLSDPSPSQDFGLPVFFSTSVKCKGWRTKWNKEKKILIR
jgi:hypothetical protein